MKLDNYIDFKDKALSVLGKKKVINPKDIDDIFIQFDKYNQSVNQDRMIYRGLKEAAYKMYTSSQRDWIYKNSDIEYSEYLENHLDKAKKWNNGILKKYLNSYNNGLEEKNLAYFSIMQHYGLPTPLLDFSDNPFVALYFACKDVEKCYYDYGIENIRNYFSIYFISADWLKENYYTITLKDEDINLKDIQENVYHLENDCFVNNNLNIIAQKGLFLINTSSKNDLISVFKKNNNDREQEFFGCYNIHKSLASIIIDKLKTKGIIEETLFPDLNKLKQISISR